MFLILDSARRHGVADADIRHAIRHPIAFAERDDDVLLIVGTARDGRFLEVGLDAERGVIFHAMPARKGLLP